MTHPTLVELHDIAYGFASEEEHMVDCADCARTVRLLSEERAFLRSVLGEAPRVSKWGRAVPLVAAGLLASVLVWALFGTSKVDPPIPAPAQERPEEKFDVERFIRELTSPNALRRAAARQALRAHGGAAVEALRAAGQKDLLEEVLGPEDPVLLQRLRTTRLSCSFSDVAVPDVADFLKDFLMVDVLMDQGLADRKVTISLADTPASEALEKMLTPLGLRYEATRGMIWITAKPKGRPDGFVPLRFPVSDAMRREISAHVSKLADSSIETREAAVARLERFGFAAEGELWRGLDSDQADISPACAGLLSKLYERRASLSPVPIPVRDKLASARITARQTDAPLRDFLAVVSRAAKVPIVVDPRAVDADSLLSIDVTEMAAGPALQLALAPKVLCHVTVGEAVFVTKAEYAPVRTRMAPQSTLWISSEDPVGALFEQSDLDGLRRLGEKAVPFLRFARAHVDPDLATKYEKVVQAIIAESPAWFADEPSGLERQGGEAFGRYESVKGDLDFVYPSEPEALRSLERLAGTRIEARAPLLAELPKWNLKLQGARLTDVLDWITRPYGLDYAERNGMIVIDTAAAIRKMIGK